MGVYVEILRETQGLHSSHYAIAKLDKWTREEKEKFFKAWEASDWETVYKMTEDLHGSAFSNSICRETLADAIEEEISEKDG